MSSQAANPEDKDSSSKSVTPWRWNVWQAIEKLEASQEVFYPELTQQVVPILRSWGERWDGHPEWRSILNKATLHKEVEESIVAIHQLFLATHPSYPGSEKHNLDQNPTKKIIVMDICAGKGLFSFLLSYLKPPHVEEIIMLEKAPINWYHIQEGANPTAKVEGRPWIHIWENCNLHDYDEVLGRILALPLPVAMTGIHLCKQLGPSFCGLVNGLGTQKCVYACLAPCCMPRAVTAQKNQKPDALMEGPNEVKVKSFVLAVQLEETQEERTTRQSYMERRGRLKRKPRSGPCFLCHDEKHGLIDCPLLPTLPPHEQRKVRQNFHFATIPCWNCLEFGHYKKECPQAVVRSNPSSIQPPQLELDVSKVLASPRPYHSYCHLLAEAFQNRTCQVIETELENTENHQDGNWNSERKSIFIVAS